MNKKSISILLLLFLATTSISICTNRKPRPKKEYTLGIVKQQYNHNDNKRLVIKQKSLARYRLWETEYFKRLDAILSK